MHELSRPKSWRSSLCRIHSCGCFIYFSIVYWWNRFQISCSFHREMLLSGRFFTFFYYLLKICPLFLYIIFSVSTDVIAFKNSISWPRCWCPSFSPRLRGILSENCKGLLYRLEAFATITGDAELATVPLILDNLLNEMNFEKIQKYKII